MEHVVGLPRTEAVLVSAKTGQGLPELFEAVVRRIPPPKGTRRRRSRPSSSTPGSTRTGASSSSSGSSTASSGPATASSSWPRAEYEAEEVGYLTPKPVKAGALRTGEVGYLIAGIRS